MTKQCGQQRCSLTARLATGKHNDTNSLRNTHRTLSLHGLKEDIPITTLDGPLTQGIPIIRLSDYLKRMTDTYQLHRLWGGHPDDIAPAVLEQWWLRFASLHPNLKLLEDFESGAKSPRNTIPLLFHDDEGRGGLALNFQIQMFSCCIRYMCHTHKCIIY